MTTNAEKQLDIAQDYIKYHQTRKPEAEDTTRHVMDELATITHRFTTPFMEMDSRLPEKMKKDLISVLVDKEEAMSELKEKNPDFYSIAESKGFYATTHYNLFSEKDMEDYPEQKDSILQFEQIACQQIRYYIRKGWGIQQADDLKLEGRCFGNVQEPGARTYPHYHQDVSGVLVNYLAMGDESIPYEEQIYKDMDKSSRHGNHQILFQDPRPAIGYPYWEKIYAVTPRVGLSILHPNYVWHETNTWRGEGTRVSIVVNFRIISHGYNELHETFRS